MDGGPRIEKPNKPLNRKLRSWTIFRNEFFTLSKSIGILLREGGEGSFLFSMKEQLNFFLDRTGKESVEISKSDPRPIERAAFSFDKQFPRFLMVISRYRAGGIDYRKRNYDRWRGGEGDTRGGGGMVEF